VTRIAGRYQLLDAPRAGTPQRARDLETAQTVLLRDVPLPREGESVLAHARAARGIFHPSLVTLFDVFLLPEWRVLLAYEFLPASQTMAQMSAGQPLNPRRAAALLVEVADAVAELHAHEVAHGGISQAAVLVTMKGKAKLDRVGDPTVTSHAATPADDLVALGDLLADLAGRSAPAGAVGAQAIEALVARARDRKFDSAATFAALLRRTL
jgi:serine/threonine protein kinase